MIRQLPAGLCVETVVFYLVLRALDTVEDDMEAFDDPMIKIKHLQSFYEKALEDPTWSMTGVGKVRRLEWCLCLTHSWIDLGRWKDVHMWYLHA